MILGLLAVVFVALVVALARPPAAALPVPPPPSPAPPPPIKRHHPIRWSVYVTEHKQSTRLGRRVRALRRRVLALQQELEHARHVQAVQLLPAHYTQWLCIHRYEGAWDANTGNGYYGGLQMDWNFMRAYGGEYLRRYGPAHNWTPAMQIEVAARAYNSGRGFGPWPNTRRMCRL